MNFRQNIVVYATFTIYLTVDFVYVTDQQYEFTNMAYFALFKNTLVVRHTDTTKDEKKLVIIFLHL